MDNITRYEKILCKLQDWYRQVEDCRVPLPKQFVPRTYWNRSEIDKQHKILAKWVYLYSHLDVFFQRWFVLDETTFQKWKIFRGEWKFSFYWAIPDFTRGILCHLNSIELENLFLSACCCWNSGIFWREDDQKKIKFGWNNDYGDSYLDFILCHPKVFRLHGRLQHPSGVVRSHTVKRPSYSYIIGRRPKSYVNWSCDWSTLLPLREILSAFHFRFSLLLKQ